MDILSKVDSGSSRSEQMISQRDEAIRQIAQIFPRPGLGFVERALEVTCTVAYTILTYLH